MTVFVSRVERSEAAGLRFAVKDCIDVSGLATEMGSAAYSDSKPASKNAEIVERLLQFGYQLIGKLSMHELAFGMTGINAYIGTPLNPNFPRFIPGGSSSGPAVAVASGEVDVAIGTDTGGSIRLPAACCGVIGLKPTYGRVSREGVYPPYSSLDSVGPMAADIDQIERCMQAMDPSFEPVRFSGDLQLGWLDLPVSSDIEAVMNSVLETIESRPDMSVIDSLLPNLSEAHSAGMTLIAYEAYQSFKDLDRTKLGVDVAKRLDAASRIGKQDVAQANGVKVDFSARVDGLLEGMDALITPTLPHLPLHLEDAINGAEDLQLSCLIRPFNLSGHPAISIPVGSETGMPIGLQIVGAKGKDEQVCAIARRLIDLEI